ncbi:MAG: hypothetical protein HJHJAOHD_02523 [Flavobacteriales bacterium]|nr:hypothetical protein [Flavobacteriales bacterium]
MRISVNTGNKFSAFGSTQPNPNNLNANQYRYGFGGMEQDKQSSSYTTYFRQYDPRIARWKSTDPVTQPWQSPYTAFDNNPIFYTDPSGAIAVPNKRRGIGAGGSIGGIGGALAGSAQTLLSLAIRSGMQASMVGTYMQSAFLPTSSATSSGRELGVGNESTQTNNIAANDLYACLTCPREVNEGNGNKKTLTPAQKIDYTISESKSKFDADFDYILNGTDGNYLTRWAETFSRDWNAASFTDKADFSIDLASTYFPFLRIVKIKYVKDIAGGLYRSATFSSKGEAWSTAWKILGKNSVKIEPYKWRSTNGRFQLRAKPGDINHTKPHIHIERLNPKTGEVIENWHFYYPK